MRKLLLVLAIVVALASSLAGWHWKGGKPPTKAQPTMQLAGWAWGDEARAARFHGFAD